MVELSDLETIFNARDLGGLPTSDGLSVTRARLLFRSAKICTGSPRDASLLIDKYKVYRVLDLRGREGALADEIDPVIQKALPVLEDAKTDGPGRLPMTFVTRSLKYDFFALLSTREMLRAGKCFFTRQALRVLPPSVATPEKRKESAAALTCCWVSSLPKKFASIYSLMATADSGQNVFNALSEIVRCLEQSKPVWVHCNSGKDRTGIVSAMVLLSVGVSEEQILRDYELSNKFTVTDKHREAILGYDKEEWPDMAELQDPNCELAAYYAAPRTTMEIFLADLREKFNGSELNYLDWIGFNKKWRRRLCAAFLEPAGK